MADVTLNAGSANPWVVPTGVGAPRIITIECFGAGGAGGAGTSASGSGGGGGAGAYSKKTNYAVTPGQSISYTIGAGGVKNNTGKGGDGGFTAFPTTSPVCKGAGGIGGQDYAGGGAGGAGGAEADSIGDASSQGKGGDGGAQNVANGGGGGESGWGVGDGNAGTAGASGGAGGTGTAGYDGGAGAAAHGQGADAPSYAGGGGGAGHQSGGAEYGGTGGAGVILITYTTLDSAPTVDLNTPNSPADGGTGISVTPELNFIGTDTNADTIEYNVQVDTGSGFNSQTTTNGVVASVTESGASGYTVGILRSGSYIKDGQSFQNNVYQTTLKSANFYLKKWGSGALPTGNAVATLYSHQGVYGTSSSPNTLLATSDTVDVATALTTSWQLIPFTFSGGQQYVLQPNTYYIIAIEYSGGDVNNSVLVGGFGTDTTAGNGSYYYSSSWTANNSYDFTFYVYADWAVPLLSKFSVTPDATFTDVTSGHEAETHPFHSGDQIKYVVQAGALTNSQLYYWRVAGKDPSGTATYGAWSDIHSFTTASASGWKTFNGLQKSSVKTINSLATASVKSINGTI